MKTIQRGTRLALVGLLVGAALTLWSARAIAGLLFGIEPLDPATFAGVAALLALVALAANLLPSLRALRTEPVTVLREQ